MKLSVFFTIGVLLGLITAMVRADDQPILNLNITITDNKPWGWRNEQNEIAGVIPDIMARLETETGIHFTLTLAPVARVVHNAASGLSDITLFIETPALLATNDRIYLIHTHKAVLLYLKNKTLDIDNLQGQRLALPSQLMANFPQLKDAVIENFSNVDLLPKILLAGRVDAIVSMKEPLMYNIKLLNQNYHDLFNEQVLLEMPSYLWVSRKSPHYDVIMNEKIEAIRAVLTEELLNEILSQYISPNDSE